MDINKIATFASRVKKRNKAEAFDIVRQLIEHDDKAPSETDLVNLYSFFLPNLPAKAKTGEQWVLKAVAKDDRRGYLNYLYSDGQYLIGTDGSRLHRIPAELPAGYYDKALNAIEHKGPYPGTSIFFGPRPGEQEFAIALRDLPVVETSRGVIWCYEIAIPDQNEPVYINRSYLEDALNRAGGGRVRVLDSVSYISVIGPDGRGAVVMPVRYKRED